MIAGRDRVCADHTHRLSTGRLRLNCTGRAGLNNYVTGVVGVHRTVGFG